MRLFSRETWSYAILLVILFAMASVAVWQTIVYIEARVPRTEFGTIAALIWSLTLGFMLIAGAFGIWAVEFSAEAESRRRIGQLVSAMEYLHDGLLAIDPRGRITGANPAVARFAGRDVPGGTPVEDAFPCLREGDVRALQQSRVPAEVERTAGAGAERKTLRFRSQPAEGLTLVLISDVTTMEAYRQHKLQAARLQLIGQLARGVANDFNNILCGIAGHASLLPRLSPGSAEQEESVRAIARNAERGIALAGHLLDLSQHGRHVKPATSIADRLRTLAGVLRDMLPARWRLDVTGTDLPPTALGGMLLDQVLINLTQLLVEGARDARTLVLIYGPPGSHPLLDIPASFAGGIVLSSTSKDTVGLSGPDETVSDEYGVLQSVIASILDGAGGSLDVLHALDGGPIFRVRLPPAGALDDLSAQPELPFDVGAYISDWKIVLGCPARTQSLAPRLQALHARTLEAPAISAVLAAIENPPAPDALILDHDLLGEEPDLLLKAMQKLSPRTGLVVLYPPEAALPAALPTGVKAAHRSESPDRIIVSMVEARSMAAARTRGNA